MSARNLVLIGLGAGFFVSLVASMMGRRIASLLFLGLAVVAACYAVSQR